jgi:D-tyrosyl-tRNA(Tyr) deacylase
VKRAEVRSEGEVLGAIGAGFVVLLGVAEGDGVADAVWLAAKVVGLRVLADEEGKMNRDLLETGGDVLVVSQFTLHAAYKKGNRPSFIAAARPETAIPLYERFVAETAALLGRPVATGRFGADMDVELINDGPVTILMDTATKN